jgi:alpha-glucosidase
VRQLGALLLAGLALGAGTAEAAVPPGGVVGPTTPTISWEGQVYASGSVNDPARCPPQAADPINLVCDHFTLRVEDAGTVTATISWTDPDNDFDLYLCDPGAATCTASSTSRTGMSETLTWTAPGPATYELRVVPLSMLTPSGYTGTATYAAPGGGGGATCSAAALHVVVPPLAEVCVGVSP